ncbi:probable plastid-lipid-associated protein 4, chloroplastic isoform X2 [Cannabis sativa]|uniref:probable plastid-lipid-associated protein 4, chloroplastic isoform X2 n=1 Tax=Cannabis sativa TaxID=3483 RepID=UPI0011E001B4|nr:probable plastid-lipid-associated protein 4, chloroplastic isoform X2 [Cannabis sativa]
MAFLYSPPLSLASATVHSSPAPRLLLNSSPTSTSLNHHFPTSEPLTAFHTPLTTTSDPQKWRVSVSFFSSLLPKKRQELKEELLEAIAPLDRGAAATPEDQERIDRIARKLEAANPTKEPLKSDLLNGKWELLYTTSRSISQAGIPKFLRSIANYQAINVDTCRAQNMESWPFFNQIPFKAPDRFRGELDTTYLDEELRVSRGDLGNLFILKMIDPSYRVPV